MLYNITFAATGGLLVEANSMEEAKEKFKSELLGDAARELVMNGIDITDCEECYD